MKALIIHGYYDEYKNCKWLLDGIKDCFHRNGVQQVDVINTCSFTKEHFKNNSQDLTASTAQWYRGFRKNENEALIKKDQDKILGASYLVFMYPIWWESLPHYMVSWMSEVFRSVSFRVDETGRPNPQWGGNRKVMIITTAGFSQEVRREQFLQLLPSQQSNIIRGKSNSEIDSMITLAQTYPLITALNYAGLKIATELHFCGIDNENLFNPVIQSAITQNIDPLFDKTLIQNKDAKQPLLRQYHRFKKPYLNKEVQQLIKDANRFKPQSEKRNEKKLRIN